VHFFNPRLLAEKLRDGVLSEPQKFSYTVASVVIRLVAEIPHRLFDSPHPLTYVFGVTIFNAVVSILGLRVCFATNARGDNKNFIERWLCLTLPLFVWTSLLPSCLTLFCRGLYALMGRGYYGLFSLLGLVLAAGAWLLFILYFVLLNRFIAIAASGTNPGNDSFAPIAAP
jgi:hypothetical protein